MERKNEATLVEKFSNRMTNSREALQGNRDAPVGTGSTARESDLSQARGEDEGKVRGDGFGIRLIIESY